MSVEQYSLTEEIIEQPSLQLVPELESAPVDPPQFNRSHANRTCRVLYGQAESEYIDVLTDDEVIELLNTPAKIALQRCSVHNVKGLRKAFDALRTYFYTPNQHTEPDKLKRYQDDQLRHTAYDAMRQVLHSPNSTIDTPRSMIEARITNAKLRIDKQVEAVGTGQGADWRIAALCRAFDPELFSSVKGTPEQTMAKIICRSCTVQYECLEDALEQEVKHYGKTDEVRGGLNQEERGVVSRRRKRNLAAKA